MNMKRLMGIAAGMLLFSTMLFAGGRQEATAPTAAGEEGELPYAGVELHFAVAAEQFADYMKVLAQEFEKTPVPRLKWISWDIPNCISGLPRILPPIRSSMIF